MPCHRARRAALRLFLVLALAAVLIPGGTVAVAQTARDWVPLADATIHPGVQTVTDGNQCTANFVFTDALGAVYLGQAAHCASADGANQTDGCRAQTADVGTLVEVDGATAPGVMVYSSWVTMQQAEETDLDACGHNDFALVRLDPADHGSVNPSLPFYGGPHGIAATTASGDPVYTFGNSSLRPGSGSAKTGTSQGTDAGGWTHDVRTPTNPGIPGDSGSGFVDGSGRAFGVLSTLEVFPDVANNGVSDLSRMLAYLAAHTDLAVTLADGTLQFDSQGRGVDTAAGGDAPDAQVDRLAGPDGTSRVETAVAISVDARPSGGAGAVVLARADVAADALAGTPLAAAADAPVLLTQPDALHPATREEVDRLLGIGGLVYLLGGDQAIAPAIAGDLTASGYRVVRLAGPSRVETAIAIAEETRAEPAQVLLADGATFADALVAGPAAHAAGGVVLLTDGHRSHPAVDRYLADHPDAQVVAIGATAAQAYPGRQALVGAGAEDTARMVAEAYVADPAVVGLARVDVFADALAGGAHIALLGGPLLLTDPDRLSDATDAYLRSRAATIDRAVLYGGTAAIAPAVADQVRTAIT